MEIVIRGQIISLQKKKKCPLSKLSNYMAKDVRFQKKPKHSPS